MGMPKTARQIGPKTPSQMGPRTAKPRAHFHSLYAGPTRRALTEVAMIVLTARIM